MLRIILLAVSAWFLTVPASAGYVSYQQCIEHNLLSKNVVMAIQEALKKAGVYSGKPDGKIGKTTREALRKYSIKMGLGDSDQIGMPVVRALLSIGAEDADMSKAETFCEEVMGPH
jgi:peptidoglycan hydrolase-like protein with peptidoglycan-binding domain